jgi:hypothetical protein
LLEEIILLETRQWRCWRGRAKALGGLKRSEPEILETKGAVEDTKEALRQSQQEIKALNGVFVKEFNWPMALYLASSLGFWVMVGNWIGI